MADAEEEWEYEYDENETEDFYFSLDLSNVQPREPVTSSKDTGPASGTSTLRNKLRGRYESTEDAIDPPSPPQSISTGGLQITNLHTPNPIIRYDNRLLSCKWTSTIGTDMYFVKPDSDLGHSLRNLNSADLLAISSTKLMAIEARLRPRDEILQQVPLPEMVLSDPKDSSGVVEAEDTRLPATSFLQKLNEAKAKRGDKTRLAITKSSGEHRLIVDEVQANDNPEIHSNAGSADDTMQLGEEGALRPHDGNEDIVMGEDHEQT